MQIGAAVLTLAGLYLAIVFSWASLWFLGKQRSKTQCQNPEGGQVRPS